MSANALSDAPQRARDLPLIFDLSRQIQERRQADRRTRSVFWGMGVLVLLAGVWILLVQGPKLNAGLQGEVGASAIVLLGLVEVAGAFFIGREEPYALLTVSQGELRFHRPAGDLRVELMDPRVTIFFFEMAQDPKAPAKPTTSVGLRVPSGNRLFGVRVPREAYDCILAMARESGLQVKSTESKVGVFPTSRLVTVVTITSGPIT